MVVAGVQVMVGCAWLTVSGTDLGGGVEYWTVLFGVKLAVSV